MRTSCTHRRTAAGSGRHISNRSQAAVSKRASSHWRFSRNLELLVVESINALRKVRENTDVPLCVGERRFTRWDYVELFRERLVDYVMPDIAWTGGKIYHQPHGKWSDPDSWDKQYSTKMGTRPPPVANRYRHGMRQEFSNKILRRLTDRPGSS